MPASGRWPILAIVLLMLLASCVAPAPFEGLVETRDGQMFARCTGAGPDVVLLHGLGDSSVTWRRLEPSLRGAGYRVTVLDALGAGRSDKPPAGPYDIPAHVRRLCVVLDGLGIGRAVLLANSLGGSVTLRFAELHPARVRALALISPAAYPEGGWTGEELWNQRLLPDLLERMPPARSPWRRWP